LGCCAAAGRLVETKNSWQVNPKAIAANLRKDSIELTVTGLITDCFGEPLADVA
jgi:hypothetical protein